MKERKAMSSLTVSEARKMLTNWITFNKKLMTLSYDGLKTLLQAELDGQRRIPFVLRLHARMNKLRHEQELQMLVRGELPRSLM